MLATLATRRAAGGDDVIVVTGDRDTYQLVEDPHIKVLYNRRGVSDYVLYDEAGIEERTGVTPAQLSRSTPALRGDPSDNLPGVPGVGEKTAAKLINTYGDLDGIFAHLDELTPKLRQSLADSEAESCGQRRRHPARPRRPGGDRRPRRGPRRMGSRGGAPAVRLPGVSDARGTGSSTPPATASGEARPGRRRRPPSRSRSSDLGGPSAAIELLPGLAGRRRSWPCRRRVGGRAGRSSRARPGVRGRYRRSDPVRSPWLDREAGCRRPGCEPPCGALLGDDGGAGARPTMPRH